MTERDALLAAILSSPGDDTPRLIYADWLDDRGEVERAEFIRVQCELARIQCGRCKGRGTYSLHAAGGFGQRGIPCDMACGAYDLRRRERELLEAHGEEWATPVAILSAREWDAYGTHRDRMEHEWRWVWCRGFVSSITLSWSDWLRHHERLFWSPRQTVGCPACKGKGSQAGAKFYATSLMCQECKGVDDRGVEVGTGRIPRPFVNTAQPIEMVRLTTWPEGHLDSLASPFSEAREIFFTYGGHTFDRVKCDVCDDVGYVCDCDPDGCETCFCSDYPCESCNRLPLNRWECKAWPGVQFVMPE